MKELVHAFSCAHIGLWTHLRSLESTQEARVALGCASSNSYASSVVLSKPASITRYTQAKHEPVLNLPCFQFVLDLYNSGNSLHRY